MNYSKEVIKAINIMCEAHKGKVDKSGVPYIFHPYHVAEQMEFTDSTVAALLHDVVEDSDWTIERLRAEGISEDVLEALELLTHKKYVPYLDYIKAMTSNRIAMEVKIADLCHNMDKTRFCGEIPEFYKKKYGTYRQALDILEQAYNEYIENSIDGF